MRIDSKAEENHFFSLVNRDPKFVNNVWAHVGGIKVGDGWAWREDFTQIYPGMMWYPGDPNNYGNKEYCLGIGKITNVGYVDISCFDNPSWFFCQKTVRFSDKDLLLCSAITEVVHASRGFKV